MLDEQEGREPDTNDLLVQRPQGIEVKKRFVTCVLVYGMFKGREVRCCCYLTAFLSYLQLDTQTIFERSLVVLFAWRCLRLFALEV